jgi:hypothetical protein
MALNLSRRQRGLEFLCLAVLSSNAGWCTHADAQDAAKENALVSIVQ